MAPWHLDAHVAALFNRLDGDPFVRSLLGSFQDATGVRIWLAPLSPLPVDEILKHAHGHPFCRAFVAVSKHTRTHCLRVHCALRSNMPNSGGVVRSSCAAGILHAALPLSILKRPVGLLIIGGVTQSPFNNADAVANLQRFFEKEGGGTALPPRLAEVLEDTESRSERQIHGLLHMVATVASCMENRLLCLDGAPEPHALPAALFGAINYLKTNFADSSLTAPDVIAKELGVSQRWLRKLFREHLGISLTDWLARVPHLRRHENAARQPGTDRRYRLRVRVRLDLAVLRRLSQTRRNHPQPIQGGGCSAARLRVGGCPENAG